MIEHLFYHTTIVRNDNKPYWIFILFLYQIEKIKNCVKFNVLKIKIK